VRNHLIVLLRNLQRDRLYAALNIAGLALAVGCCLILALYLRNELSYDRHSAKQQRIFRVVNEREGERGTPTRAALTSYALGPMLAAHYPQVQAYARFTLVNASSISSAPLAIHHGGDTFYWDRVYVADANVFDLFDHRILYGDPKTALKGSGTVAVSETFARKYFGETNPIGQTITTDLAPPFRITLVFADLPGNSHLKYDVLFSGTPRNPFFFTLGNPDDPSQQRQELWGFASYTYLLMAPGFRAADWNRINDDFYLRFMAAEDRARHMHWKSWLQPLPDVHFTSAGLVWDQPTGNRAYLYGAASVALFVLAVACINYINLATARATRRARAVGIRKILGQSRGSLAAQFLGEAILFALIAVVLGVALTEVALSLTPISGLLDNQVHLDLLHEPALLGWLLAGGLLLGLISGAYPALYLSGWAPLTALTARQTTPQGARLRSVLVLLQFTISAAVIAGTVLMAAQMHYVATRPLGFEKQNRMIITLRGLDIIDNLPTIRTELLKNRHVLAVATTASVMGRDVDDNTAQVEKQDGSMTSIQLSYIDVQSDFIPAMGLRLLKGRNLPDHADSLPPDHRDYVVNEALVRQMGWTEPLGKRIQMGSGPLRRSGRVIGVVQDFNYASLHSPVEPLALRPPNSATDVSHFPAALRPYIEALLVLKVSGDDLPSTIGFITDVMRRLDPTHPLDYSFLDDELDSLYQSDHVLATLIGVLAAVCILIACLGVFGLAAFTTEQRSREIGTRKALGASTLQIILLLSRRILLLVLIAAVLATIIAYFAIDRWLAGFAYHTGINPLAFVLAALIAAVVAFATVAAQSYRTASADPVEALRYE
jgi:putative ABC transport system permease protein